MSLIAGANLLLILLAPEAVAVFAPKAYYNAIYVIPPVSMSVFFMFSYDLFSKFEFYFEKTGFIMAASVTGALINLVTNYIFIQRYGCSRQDTRQRCSATWDLARRSFSDDEPCLRTVSGRDPSFSGRKKYWGMAPAFMAAGFVLLFTYRSRPLRYGPAVIIAGL